jgi:putative transposase
MFTVETEALQAPLADVSQAEPIAGDNLQQYSDNDWKTAEARLAAIGPCLERAHRSPAAVVSRAAECGVHATTLYRWLRKYVQTPALSSLMNAPRTGGRGTSRLTFEQDKLIDEAIQGSYLTPQRRRAQTICRLAATRAKDLGIPAPHSNTVRNRIAALNPELLARKRHGTNAARALHAVEGAFPLTNAPLEVVQIDHTPLDIILVDEQYRMPIGRPWITVALDVYSRMVTGYHISLEPPGSLTTALCIAHSVSRKDEWLAKHNISGEWPCSGIMQCIHVDNAKEFHSEVLTKACLEYGIQLRYRPPGQPHYGGNIERFIGTLAGEIHELAGTTFSNVQERGDYDSDKHSSFTLDALRLWVAKYLIEIYHERLHSTLKTTPLARFKQGMQEGYLKGHAPRMPADFRKLELDFLPGAKRAVQRYGIQLDSIRYWHDILRAWANAPALKNKTRKQLFWIKRDPRDIKFVYFFDPVLQSYHRIPCRDASLPSISLTEYKLAAARVRQRGFAQVNETRISTAIAELSQIESEQIQKTRSVRRAKARRILSPAPLANSILAPVPIATPSATSPQAPKKIDQSLVMPFPFTED